ncbi:hypothetical protein SARC_02875 [Sphaeroforma arctica JP610]|uniref:Uncharacterized protein n=1 Tax=Sphaeroforma arctica JP610 TaxID=667725 RepID=A0A0L0G7Q6_9EUKA|nr:hypothetical protein SARC_02875 [Sphaeroforma arctica JP610]KNC84921.1 hypothetical protein SARC_02875 [Sphaeroforma arctica JP610]|eukprot:XP_014158823.1 hypothetical protein SARC_02875 [Sphaeroforma arctica JP610]
MCVAFATDAICHSIDRYHYLDLYPVDDNELERMGYQKLAPESSGEGVQSVAAIDDTVSAINSDFVVPDLKCLDHFNPEQGVVGPLTGPKSITALLANLPPPMNFIGPYVDVEAFLAGLSPPDEADVPQSATDKRVEATQTPASNEDAVKSGTGKRKKKSQGDSDDETTNTVRATKGTIRRPVNIFNKRMRSTLAKDNQ